MCRARWAQTNCNGACANLQADPAHCGMCGAACAPGNACSSGKCGVSCPMGQVVCANACVNLQTDNVNCGACGLPCAMGTLCVAGKCAVTCGAPNTNCSGVCTNLQIDAANCGKCAMACPMGQACIAGACKFDCPMGQTACGNGCVNILTDNANCGACGMACPQGTVCSMGQCGLACRAPLTNCNGLCVDSRFDPANCGSCGKVCAAAANGSALCNIGNCTYACNAGFADCDVNPANGCEVNVAGNINHCGACGKVCGPAANAGPLCNNGNCAIACNGGFGDCDMNPANGCEANLTSNNSHCGACGMACVNGALCMASVCVAASNCLNNAKWQKVSCTTPSWVWSSNRNFLTAQAANVAHTLETGCAHGQPQPQLSQGVCSLDGKGWVSTQTFTMANCNNGWYHIGGSFSGNCGGHDGDLYRHLVLGDNDCYNY